MRARVSRHYSASSVLMRWWRLSLLAPAVRHSLDVPVRRRPKGRQGGGQFAPSEPCAQIDSAVPLEVQTSEPLDTNRPKHLAISELMPLVAITEKMRAERASKERLMAEFEDVWRDEASSEEEDEDGLGERWAAILGSDAAIKSAARSEKRALGELVAECTRLAGVIRGTETQSRQDAGE